LESKPHAPSNENNDDSIIRSKNSRRLESIRDSHATKQINGRRTESMEDYLEVIYELIQEKGFAATTDIAIYLNVSSPSVTKMVRRLDKDGYLKYERYRGIILTSMGLDVARGISKRHTLLIEFLKMIGLSDEIANEDAEGIEHHLHPATLQKLDAFIKFAKTKDFRF
jgi:Mn-dependent DtxR family transcriptional regulator